VQYKNAIAKIGPTPYDGIIDSIDVLASPKPEATADWHLEMDALRPGGLSPEGRGAE
jgi:hypothetical protein